MGDFSTNMQKVRFAEEEFQKIAKDINRTLTWDESSMCRSSSHRLNLEIAVFSHDHEKNMYVMFAKTIEEAIYDANGDLNDRISMNDFIQAVRSLLRQKQNDDDYHTEMVLPNETKVAKRKIEFTDELFKLMDDGVTVTQQMLKDLREKYNLPPSAT
ncbi:unnamed protein product [Adineta ricciae]|uniref:Uncharacterized protein n=1 Tax=Adineta ricciae TaxID=249248 RepID=A0A814CNK5_ADIRI|nr:unnamed protein product [Adineta ricciae]